MDRNRSILLAVPYKGLINGHLTTANSIKKSIIKFGLKIKEIEQPTRYNHSVIKYLQYIFKIINFNIKEKNKIYYIFLHRTRFSFYLKDLPIFVFAIFSKSRIVVHLIGGDLRIFFDKLTSLEKSFFLFLFSKISNWVVLGKKMKKDILFFEKNKKKIIINPGLYENINFKNIKKSKNNEIVISYMSHLIYEKGIVLFIKLVIDLVENHKLKIKVRIAGKILRGFENKEVEEIIKIANEKDYIFFDGVLKGYQKWKFLSSSTIFVLPTFYQSESLPLVLLDAMRAGCYCISNSIGEIGYLLSENRGCAISNITKNKLKNKILMLIKNPNKIKESSSRAKKFVINNFSQNKYDEMVIKTLS